MYASFFGFRELPFNNTPDPRFFFSTPDHEEALASLIYAIDQSKGFVMLTGEVGSGKTLITRLMLRHFGEKIEFAAINNTQVSAQDLLQSVCAEFQLPADPGASNAELIRALQDFLIKSFAANRPVVLMLDEAQALSREAFEQVRMIGNLEADDAKLLQIVIVGQPELRDRFETNDMRQLRQRIFRSFHLSALSREQTEGYIRHRISVAGVHYPDEVFETSAVDTVFEYSQGLPRLINTVCDNALLSAYAAGQRPIDGAFVRQVISQMMTVAQGGPHYASPRVSLRHAPHLTAGCLPSPSAAGAAYPLWATDETAMRDDLEHARRKCTQRLADEARQIGEDGAKKFSRDIERAAEEQLSRLSDETRRHCRASALKLAEDLQQAGRLCLQQLTIDAHRNSQAVIERIREAESRAAPVLEESRQSADLVRRMLREAKASASEVRALLQSARATKASTEQALALLGRQTARTSRLAVALRKVYDKIERRAADLDGTTAEAPSTTACACSRRNGRRILEKTKNLDREIHHSRKLVDEVRDLIEATTQGHLGAPSRNHGSASQSAPRKTRRSRFQHLSNELKALSATVPGARQP